MSEPGISIIQPRGRIDALHARELWRELEPLTQMQGARVIVDLSETRYLSSEGIRVLLRASKAAQQNGGQVALCSLSARLLEIIAMTGLERVFDLHPTRADAERSFANF